MTKTEQLTAKELARIDTITVRSDIQRETLALRKRSGLRYGTSVDRGRYTVCVVAYALSAKGEPKGVGSIRVVRENLFAEEVPGFLATL